MNVAVVSHFVEDATDSGVVPETSPTVCSWITVPSSATIRIMPPAVPADRSRCSSNASVVSKVPGSNAVGTALVVVVVVVVGAGVVVETGTALDAVVRSTDWLRVLVSETPQPASTSAHMVNTTVRRHTRVRERNGTRTQSSSVVVATLVL